MKNVPKFCRQAFWLKSCLPECDTGERSVGQLGCLCLEGRERAAPEVSSALKALSRLLPRFLLPSQSLQHPSLRACSVASVMSDSLQACGLQPAKLFCSWDSPGKNTGLACHALLQGIFLTQGSNRSRLCLLCCRMILFLLSHLGSLQYSRATLSITLQLYQVPCSLVDPVREVLGRN